MHAPEINGQQLPVRFLPPWLTHTQTQRERDRQTALTGYTISSARWTKNR